jgi:broad specificity phosphatase PhoE
LPAVTRLLLVRHGESTWNAERRWQGWADPPLSPRGEEQARQAARALAASGLTAVVCSDLQRARRTAELLGEALGLGPPRVEPGLRERNVGEWSGLTLEEIEDRWPGALEEYRSGRYFRPPGGEDSETLVARVEAALGRVAERFAGGTPLVVAHGGVIRTLERRLALDPLPSPLPNLAGRWFRWEGGTLAGGDLVLAVEPGLVTAPGSQ